MDIQNSFCEKTKQLFLQNQFTLNILLDFFPYMHGKSG